MPGKCSITAIVIVTTFFLIAPLSHAYRICTFKGTVIDHGWRSMSVKSGTQCAEVNVGWRTKYMPNRRPCIGERVAVDFILEDGYMKATKIVSLSPLPPSVQCYPPAPPSSAVCRTVQTGDEIGAIEGGPCGSPRGICSNKAPAYVTDPNWSPGKKTEGAAKPTRQAAKKPSERDAAKPSASTREEKTEQPAVTDEKKSKVITGEVVATSTKSLSIRTSDEGDAGGELANVKVGLKTKFIPFRRPAVGEKVRVEYRQENGDKFGYTVQVVQ